MFVFDLPCAVNRFLYNFVRDLKYLTFLILSFWVSFLGSLHLLRSLTSIGSRNPIWLFYFFFCTLRLPENFISRQAVSPTLEGPLSRYWMLVNSSHNILVSGSKQDFSSLKGIQSQTSTVKNMFHQYENKTISWSVLRIRFWPLDPG